jgi:hypothetical protein
MRFDENAPRCNVENSEAAAVPQTRASEPPDVLRTKSNRATPFSAQPLLPLDRFSKAYNTPRADRAIHAGDLGALGRTCDLHAAHVILWCQLRSRDVYLSATFSPGFLRHGGPPNARLRPKSP